MIAGKSKLARYYDDLLEKYGDHYLSLDWKSPESQPVRFSVLLDIIMFTTKSRDISILDVGCGLGHLLDFLQVNGLVEKLNVKYSGIDIAPKMIEAARQRHPSVNFEVVDLINDRYNKTFDFAVMSGIFNVRMAELEAHKETVRKMLSRMFALCRYGAAANFKAHEIPDAAVNKSDDRYVYFSEEEVISWVKEICGRFVLRRDYHLGDFTVYMLK
jgi:SAM-dependent methyltransferase